jgi:hypothetical protein
MPVVEWTVEYGYEPMQIRHGVWNGVRERHVGESTYQRREIPEESVG